MCRIVLSCLLLWSIACACADRKDAPKKATLFKLLDPHKTNIHFVNQLDYTESVNTYTFKNFYNGGGVGLGDFNNDSLLDVFFTGNLVSNKLYLNKGNLTFEDISETAGLVSPDSWSTGVSVVDINADGMLDIYVCKSGPPEGTRRHNELFINNGDLTFSERAQEYGLNFVGLSTHAAFFDYDKDGDLDCYLLNNSIRSIGGYDLRKDQRKIPDSLGGNKLLRNDSGKFIDVSAEAGIYTSMIGFGLGVTIGDINKDGWSDMYVSNDFFEKDYLYINNKNGTFEESLEQYLREISLGSMGADMADLNNDGLPEIFVTEMLPATDDRLKTTSQFENWDKYNSNVKQGYYHQFSRNTLQLNNGDGTFSEISRFAGVHATDWSWGALIFDMDKDGNKDIFVANGIFKDLLDQDYVNFVSDRNMVKEILRKEGSVIKQLIDSIPSNRITNFAFRNKRDLTFQDETENWGFGEPTHSNGSAYGDLDNDGDMDLVLNNANMVASVYENRAESVLAENNFITFVLHGDSRNTFSIGAKIMVMCGDKTLYQEHSPMRGFMSSVDYKINFGLGALATIDSVIVEWPDDRVSVHRNVKANQVLHLYQQDAQEQRSENPAKQGNRIFTESEPSSSLFKHVESEFVDFDRDRLLFNMISNEGPCVCTGDISGDGLDDFYVGGAKNQPGALFIQNASGKFFRRHDSVIEADRQAEDTDCAIFDANNDGHKDLYVTSGSNEFSTSSTSLLDRLYFNMPNGFRKSEQLLPVSQRFESTSTVEPIDFDGDGDQDLFVGVRVIPGFYGVPCNGYLLENDGNGKFSDITDRAAPEFIDLGMIRDAKWIDANKDSFLDLVIVGDWMEISLFLNIDGKRLQKAEGAFRQTNGWYNTVETGDFNNDGLIDLVIGNHGLNSRFKASVAEPLQMYINDFDQNGSIEHITTRYYNGKSLPLVLRQDLVLQIPSLKKKYLHFEKYKSQAITDIFTHDQLAKVLTLNAFNLETAVWLNVGDGTFMKSILPAEAQFSPVYAILVDDVDKDNNMDIVLGGNLYRAKPETGIYDASYGLVLKGNGKAGFTVVRTEDSGLSIKGEVRSLKRIGGKKTNKLIVARNNEALQIFTY